MKQGSFILNSPLGPLTIHSEGGVIVGIEYKLTNKAVSVPQDKLVTQLQQQLGKYFKNPRHHLDVPFKLHGTDFQQRVWHEMQQIPSGETRSYGEVAKRLQSSARAVGNACRANPIPIIIPCHRIVGKNGLGGYDGQTSGRKMKIKQWLLQHEGVPLDA